MKVRFLFLPIRVTGAQYAPCLSSSIVSALYTLHLVCPGRMPEAQAAWWVESVLILMQCWAAAPASPHGLIPQMLFSITSA